MIPLIVIVLAVVCFFAGFTLGYSTERDNKDVKELKDTINKLIEKYESKENG